MNPRMAALLVFSTILQLAACKSPTPNANGSNTRHFKTALPPILEGDAHYDCKSPNVLPTAQMTQQPSEIHTPNLSFRSSTRECTPAKGKAADETCSQQVWTIIASYDVKSDFTEKKWQNNQVTLDEIVCDCICVKNAGGCDPSKLNKDGGGAGVCRN